MTPEQLAWLRYANQNATRNKPLDPRLIKAMSFLPEMGVTMEVFSGGQDGKGEGTRRTGSTRHDHGGAADVKFYKDGQLLDWANPAQQPMFADIVSRAKAAGVTGFGAGDGYMQPASMHIGFGAPAVWGAGGNSANAPEWLRKAYGMTPQGAAGPAGMPAPAAAPGPAGMPQSAMPAASASWRDRVREIFQQNQDKTSALAGMVAQTQPPPMEPVQFQQRQGYQAPEDPVARAYAMLQRVRGG